MLESYPRVRLCVCQCGSVRCQRRERREQGNLYNLIDNNTIVGTLNRKLLTLSFPSCQSNFAYIGDSATQHACRFFGSKTVIWSTVMSIYLLPAMKAQYLPCLCFAAGSYSCSPLYTRSEGRDTFWEAQAYWQLSNISKYNFRKDAFLKTTTESQLYLSITIIFQLSTQRK